MELPLEIRQLLKQFLERVRLNPEHQLKRNARFLLYRSFKPASLASPQHMQFRDEFVYEESAQEENFNEANKGDYVISWLGILAVKFALAEWELVTNLDEWEKEYLDDVKEMLRNSQGLLLEKLDFEEVGERLSSDYLYSAHSFVTKNLASLYDAAVTALEVILYGSKEYDVAESALEAYSVIDLNLDGEGNSEEPLIPLEYDLTKRLKFWEWWLTEAIPQAWELANKTFPGKSSI